MKTWQKIIFILAAWAAMLLMYFCSPAKAAEVGRWSTMSGCLEAAPDTPYWYPERGASPKKLTKNEAYRGLSKPACADMDLPKSLGGRGWVRLGTDRKIVLNTETGQVVRLAECNNTIHAIYAIPAEKVANGKDGAPGAPGAPGKDGKDGDPGSPGKDGENGYNGWDGRNADPSSPSYFGGVAVSYYPSGVTYVGEVRYVGGHRRIGGGDRGYHHPRDAGHREYRNPPQQPPEPRQHSHGGYRQPPQHTQPTQGVGPGANTGSGSPGAAATGSGYAGASSVIKGGGTKGVSSGRRR